MRHILLSIILTALSSTLCCFQSNSYAQTIILSEDFEDDTFPVGWSQTTNATDGGWILGTNTELESEFWTIAEHGNFIGTNDDACDCDKSQDYLITPNIDLSDASAAVLQFQNYYDGGSLFGGTEDAFIEYSIDNGSTWTVFQEIVGTEDDAWDMQSIDLTSLTGNSNLLLAFHYFDDGEWLFGWAIDDVLIFEPEGLDLALSSLDIDLVIDVPTETNISGIVTNSGLEEINSFDLSWSIGGEVFTANLSGLDIPSLGTYQFTHPDPWSVAQSGLYDLTVSISNINGETEDLNTSNNTLNLSVQGVEYGTIIDGGISRDYIYYHASSAPDNCPIVFVCHGYTGNAEGIMGYSDFNQVAEDNGFAVCYPQGIEDSFGNTFFNVGYDFQNNETVNDVVYLQNLVTYLQSNNSLSASDIFCTGLSNGGDFCYLLACEASETFKAVAPVAGMIRQEILDDCNPINEVSIFEIHGTDDNVTPFEGDPNNNDNWGAYPSIPATIHYWASAFNLELIESTVLPDLAPNDGSTVLSERYGLEGSCTEVWLYTVEGGGHDWPGAFGNMDISASREAWDFFEGLCDTSVGLEEFQLNTDRKLIRIVDMLGREIQPQSNTVLFYQYSDGTVEKRVIQR
ncbi:MAG: polyhydroxybutyrate depolymerase [Flavobacteriales bacterium]|jgi:polyhydroxybutyrate depolymerase